jgi:DnaJ-class molecular chaperone
VHGRGKGDLTVRLTVSVPRKLTAEQKHLVEELSKSLGDHEAKAAHRKEPEEESGFGFFKRKKKR